MCIRDRDHPDLVDNIWVNEGEIPGNGIDDDGNSGIVRGMDGCRAKAVAPILRAAGGGWSGPVGMLRISGCFSPYPPPVRGTENVHPP